VTQGAHIKASQDADDCRHGLLPEANQLPTRIALTAHGCLKQVKEKRNKVIGNVKKTGLDRDKPASSEI
jgi:hypothetical protein